MSESSETPTADEVQKFLDDKNPLKESSLSPFQKAGLQAARNLEIMKRRELKEKRLAQMEKEVKERAAQRRAARKNEKNHRG